MSTTNDPRDSSLEVKYSPPKTWFAESDALGVTGMLLAGLIMVSRNRFLAWPAIIVGVNGVINQHPMRSKEGAGSAWSSLLLCISALFASYFPLLVVTQPPPKLV
ncbi:hypothetical protein BDN72DRAFT_451732 [Pluteus cervinus]|uniref:Uncharacterized protein n=1 Tax=Pluteus cervinus TaxID=181527 RepID=A0ACD3BCY3_9AGAR|nr:hypothetical protein BDN72DRAFT_451732 [Pluteus cervinus]